MNIFQFYFMFLGADCGQGLLKAESTGVFRDHRNIGKIVAFRTMLIAYFSIFIIHYTFQPN